MNTTVKAPARMTADELAQQFAERGRSGCWLSAAQTAFLVNLSRQSRGAVRFDAMRHTWHGGWTSPEGDAHSWTLYISPINRCGLFNVSVYTRKRAELEDEKRVLGDAYRVINDRMMDLLIAQDKAGIEALLGDAENRRVMARYPEVEKLLEEEASR